MSNTTSDLQNKKQRLGRGLGSLFESAQTHSQTTQAPQATELSSAPAELRIWNIAVDKIKTSAFQPRTHFDGAALAELASSIKEKGILQPIVVRKISENKFELIAGERRWRAAQIAGLHEVPAIIKTLSNKDALEIAIIENIQRENLNPVEESEAYDRLVKEFNMTQQQVAEKVGKDRATIANSLRLLALPAGVRKMIQEQKISVGHAKVLLGLETENEIQSLAEKIAKEALSVRSAEKEVAKIKHAKVAGLSPDKASDAEIAQRAAVNKIADNMQRSLGTKVVLDYSAGKGSIKILFYSNDELTEISERIISGCMN